MGWWEDMMADIKSGEAYPSVDTSQYFVYGAPQGYVEHEAAKKKFDAAAKEKAQFEEFNALVNRSRAGKLGTKEMERADYLWDQLGIPGDYRGGIAGNDNLADYLADQKGSSEKERVAYLDRKSKEINQRYATEKQALDTAAATMSKNDPVKDEMEGYNKRADEAQGRKGAQIDKTDWNKDRDLDMESRGKTMATEALYRNMAEGKGPSAAQSQYQSALDQSNRNAMSLANSARGGTMNRALAQANAQKGAGMQQAQSAAQSATLRAQEQQAAMQGLSNINAQLRTGDQNRMTGAAQMGQAQGQLDNAQMGRNDNMEQYYRNKRTELNNQRLGLGLQKDADTRNETWKKLGFSMAAENADHARDMEGLSMFLGGAGGLIQSIPIVGGLFKGAGNAQQNTQGAQAGG